MFKLFSDYRVFVLSSALGLTVACMQPNGPELAPVDDIYVGCTLVAGNGKQVVFAYGSVTDPTAQPPGDPSSFLADAIVTLTGEQWLVTLLHDQFESIESRKFPVFSTRGQQITIQPGETYHLSVEWNRREYWAETTIPSPPVFKSMDTLVTIHNEQLRLQWESPNLEHFLLASFPAHFGPWVGPIGISRQLNTLECVFDLRSHGIDSTGVARIILYDYCDDYQKLMASQRKEENGHDVEPYSNIAGAHGLFLAMATDTLEFKYRKE